MKKFVGIIFGKKVLFLLLLGREFYALKDINLEIRKSEILGIVGKNGSGKSILLKLICEIIQPSFVKVVVNEAVSALLDLSMGLNPEFCGIQNICFNGTMMGFRRKEMEEKIDDIVAFTEIENFIHQPLKTYSSGMRVRLGFTLAINMDLRILILDEVLAVGDELFKRKCFAKMEEVFNSGCIVLFVTHSINTINERSSRAILLDKGEQILEEPPKFVTMYYQKLLYALLRESEKVRDGIIELGNYEYKKKELMEKEKNEKEMNGDTGTDTDTTSKSMEETRQKPLFIPDFESKSFVEQK